MADFDDGTIVIQLQKILKTQYQQIGDAMIGGGVDNMETYKYIIGQINALEAVKQELSNLLNDKEQDEGNVVDINTKNPLTK